MKQADWNECLEDLKATERTPDKAKANSLRTTAKERIRFLKSIKKDADNLPFIFEAYYTSFLEMLHALVISEGYKVDNHICLGYYIRDVMKRHDIYELFDKCRKDRNSLVYYGSKLDPDIAEENIANMDRMVEELKGMIG